MSLEEKSFAFVERKDTDNEEDERRTIHDKYEYYMYIAWGCTLVAVSLATAGELSDLIRRISIAATAVFFTAGWVCWFRSFKWRKRKSG
jgi:hypothetical protein